MHVGEEQSGTCAAPAPRQRERRRGLGDVLATLARAVTTRGESCSVRAAFEDALQRALPVCAIALRETASRWPRDKPQDGLESVAFEVPGATPAQRGMLEATFDRASRLGEWDFQVLGHAAQLGALVLEVERGRGHTGRATPTLAPPKPKRDGAAPLIGSTAAMASLRDRIERVANTDFTILLEGETRTELAIRFELNLLGTLKEAGGANGEAGGPDAEMNDVAAAGRGFGHRCADLPNQALVNTCPCCRT